MLKLAPKPKRSPGRFQMLKRDSTEQNLTLDGFISKQESIDSDYESSAAITLN